MQPPLVAPPVRSSLNPRSHEFEENRAAMLEKLEVIEHLHDEAEAGGGPHHHERLAKRGKLPVRQRIALALDPDSPFLEISPLAGYDSEFPVGGGAVLGIGVISGVECVIFANDPTVLGGALTPYVSKKWMRALEIARDNRLPYVSFVESAGADLRMRGASRKKDDDGDAPAGGARVEHFAESGRLL
jgi:acetyl-CoA carboxylase carboxyltransferase component